MNIVEKVVPIERGGQIRIQKLKERVLKFQEEAFSLYERAVDLEKETQEKLDEAYKNPAENAELIFLLQNDLELVREDINSLDEMILEAFSKQDEFQVEIDKIKDRLDNKK
jgi:exonuclease VII small subunit